jgi:LacI family transcriptional regulator
MISDSDATDDIPRRATIVDVAARAGVSRMTVSRVVNGSPAVQEKTRRRVERAIQELSYSPNIAARSLVLAREARIAIVYSNPSGAFMSHFLARIFEQASAKGVQLVLFDGAREDQQLERVRSAGITGAILALPVSQAAVARRILGEAGIPMTAVGARGLDDAICVRIDDRCAAYEMTRHLLALGHRRLGFIIGNPDQTATMERLQGFRDAVGEMSDVQVIEVQGDYSYASGLAAGEALLDAAVPPTAIFASNDDMAAAVVSVAHRRRLDVPADVTIVGFDDTSVATTLWPPLTTVRQPLGDMAATAFERLIEKGGDGAKTEVRSGDIILDHMLVERQSTAPPAARMTIR